MSLVFTGILKLSLGIFLVIYYAAYILSLIFLGLLQRILMKSYRYMKKLVEQGIFGRWIIFIVWFQIGLFDLGFEGPKFTWKWPQYLNDHIRARLDKVLSSASFSQLFLDFVAKSTSVNHSDHLVLYIFISHTSVSSSSRLPRPKWFESHWIKANECHDFLEKLWTPDTHHTVDYVKSNIGLFWIIFSME